MPKASNRQKLWRVTYRRRPANADAKTPDVERTLFVPADSPEEAQLILMDEMPTIYGVKAEQRDTYILMP
jgi:hypothetical protein